MPGYISRIFKITKMKKIKANSMLKASLVDYFVTRIVANNTLSRSTLLIKVKVLKIVKKIAKIFFVCSA